MRQLTQEERFKNERKKMLKQMEVASEKEKEEFMRKKVFIDEIINQSRMRKAYQPYIFISQFSDIN